MSTEQELREFSKLAGRAMNEACVVIGTIEPENNTEARKLAALLDFLSDLVNQAYVLNGVMSSGELQKLEVAKP